MKSALYFQSQRLQLIRTSIKEKSSLHQIIILHPRKVFAETPSQSILVTVLNKCIAGQKRSQEFLGGGSLLFYPMLFVLAEMKA